MSNIRVVIGLGFGDEGKGVVTDFLSSLNNSVVVRFSGGHQAGHTVKHGDIKHVFSNFGSGTMRGRPTYWSKYCTVDPVGIRNEYFTLHDKGCNPLLIIDDECPITTPYDKLGNRYDTCNKIHGTCGLGFGKTLQREEDHYHLRFKDIYYPKIFNEKLDLIEKYYKEVNCSFSMYNNKIENEMIMNFFDAVQFIRRSERIQNRFNVTFKNKVTKDITGMEYIKHIINDSDCNWDIVCEGSQGMLLDQEYGFFPHVTRSNTGSKNVIEMFGYNNINRYYVTRAYQTRHGNGFMTNKDIPHNIILDPNETNKTNEYQGKFRVTLLDLDLIKYSLNNDKARFDKDYLVITCLEHMVNDYRYTIDNQIKGFRNEEEFLNGICNDLNINKDRLVTCKNFEFKTWRD